MTLSLFVNSSGNMSHRYDRSRNSAHHFHPSSILFRIQYDDSDSLFSREWTSWFDVGIIRCRVQLIFDRIRYFAGVKVSSRHVGVSSEGVNVIDFDGVEGSRLSLTGVHVCAILNRSVKGIGTIQDCRVDSRNGQTFRCVVDVCSLRHVTVFVFTEGTKTCEEHRMKDRYLIGG